MDTYVGHHDMLAVGDAVVHTRLGDAVFVRAGTCTTVATHAQATTQSVTSTSGAAASAVSRDAPGASSWSSVRMPPVANRLGPLASSP